MLFLQVFFWNKGEKRFILRRIHNEEFVIKNGKIVEAILTIDEFETIRLVDYEGFSQEKCGAKMNVSRATAQRIHRSARRKMAAALGEGCPLRIEGGEYKIKKE